MKMLVLILALPSLLLAQSAKKDLRGTKAKVVAANTIADKEHLSRLSDDSMVALFLKKGLLITLKDSKGIRVDSRLPLARRVCRPWAAAYVRTLGRNFNRQSQGTLQVNSCTRDSLTQEELRPRNRNAAPSSGPTASMHERGNTLDISRLRLTLEQENFVRKKLAADQKVCKIIATEENAQRVWHIVVWKTPHCDKPKSRPQK